MAFSLLDYYKTRGQNIPNTPEGILDAVEALLSPEGRQMASMAGQSSPEAWATAALQQIQGLATGIKDQNGESPYSLDNAYAWVTGNKQPSRAANVWRKFNENKADLERQVQNELSNIANIADFSNPNLTEEEKTKAMETIQARQAELDQLLGIAEAFGIDTNNAVVKDASGNYIPAAAARTQTGTPNSTGEESTIIKTDPNTGKLSVVGVNTGKVYGADFNSSADAQSFQNTIYGGNTTPERAGTGMVAGGVSGTSTPTPGGNAAPGATTPDVYDALANSVAEKEAAAVAANPNHEFTPEMRAEWLKQAWAEVNANGAYREQIADQEKQLGRSFERIVQDASTAGAALAESYRTGVRTLQNNLQDAGMLYGGVRTGQEQELANAANVKAAAINTDTTRALQDVSRAGEQNLGTDAAKKIADATGMYSGTGTFNPGAITPQNPVPQNKIFSIEGDRMGVIPRNMEQDALARQNELESTFSNQFKEVA